MSAPTATTIDANQTIQESNSSAITMPAAQSSEDNAALIGGIVGGAIALILIGALIACCVVRSRRNRRVDVDPNAQVLQSRPSSNYGNAPRRDAPPNNNYSDIMAVSPPANYDAWSDSNYANSGLAESTRYDDFTSIQ